MNAPPSVVPRAVPELQSGAEDIALAGIAHPDTRPLFWRAERLAAPSAWWAHVPFAQWLVTLARPRLLVELGTYTGVSYTAFCTAVQRAGLGTRCLAVDTWEGDAHGGRYGPDIYEEFRRFHDDRFGAFSTLLRATFDAALAHVADQSVDLLHIDGLHTYEAVRHDYESWLPKLSERGVVLFHDIEVRRDDFGVWRLWEELRGRYPSFSLLHGHGLGVLAVGPNAPEPVVRLCELGRGSLAAALRERLARLGDWTVAEHQRAVLEAEWARARAEDGQRAAHADQERRLAEERFDTVRRELAACERRLAAAEHAAARWRCRARDAEQALGDAETQKAAAGRHAADMQTRLEAEERRRREAELTVAELRRRLEIAERRADEASARPPAVDPALRAELARLRREATLLQQSLTWRVAVGLRHLGRRMPKAVRRAAGAAARLACRIGPGGMQRRRDLRLMADSGLFDAVWYQQQYPDVAAAGIDPLRHYALIGAAERRNPSAAFDAGWYLDAYPDVAVAGVNPLVHYLIYGRMEGRTIRPVTPAPAGEGGSAPALGRAARAQARRRHLGLDLVPAPRAEVAIGIVTYDTPEDDLRTALSAAKAALHIAGACTEGRVFILDNGSPSVAGEGDPAIRRLPARGNIGFGAGHNLLMATAFAEGAAIYVTANPDGLLHPDAIAAIVRMMHAAEFRALIEAMQFPEEHPKVYDPVSFDTPWASGACLAIPRAIYDATGGFDDGFFMYCEDVDLSWRARAAGFAVKICPPALFLHRVTNRASDAAMRRRMLQAGHRLALKWGNPDFAAHCARQLAEMGVDIDVSYVAQGPIAQRGVADFDHQFYFAPARW